MVPDLWGGTGCLPAEDWGFRVLPPHHIQRPGIGTAETEFPLASVGNSAWRSSALCRKGVTRRLAHTGIPCRQRRPSNHLPPRPGHFPLPWNLRHDFVPQYPLYGKWTYYPLTSGHRARTARHRPRELSHPWHRDSRPPVWLRHHSTGEHSFSLITRYQILRRSL
jgi:hypothetical protein